jgi:sec-independent protein translocase protein TatC
MFFIGASFAYFIILPFAFDFFLGFQSDFNISGEAVDAAAPAGVVFQGSMEAYLSITMSFVLAFGLCFQLPVLLTLMGRAGIISSAGLKGTRKYAVVLILIVAAIVTPPDIMSQFIMFCAIYPLYEVSIWLISRFERDREAQARADGTWVDPDDETA